LSASLSPCLFPLLLSRAESLQLNGPHLCFSFVPFYPNLALVGFTPPLFSLPLSYSCRRLLYVLRFRLPPDKPVHSFYIFGTRPRSPFSCVLASLSFFSSAKPDNPPPLFSFLSVFFLQPSSELHSPPPIRSSYFFPLF